MSVAGRGQEWAPRYRSSCALGRFLIRPQQGSRSPRAGGAELPSSLPVAARHLQLQPNSTAFARRSSNSSASRAPLPCRGQPGHQGFRLLGSFNMVRRLGVEGSTPAPSSGGGGRNTAALFRRDRSTNPLQFFLLTSFLCPLSG